MELEQIIEAFKTDPKLVDGILPIIETTESGKTFIENKSNVLYQSKIGDEVKKIHDMYDNDVFEVLGVRAGQKEDGSKQKTYEFVKELMKDYKDLKDKKDLLSKDAKVIELEGQIEKLKKEGGGSFIQETFEKAKLAWEQEKQDFIKKIGEANSNNETFKKTTIIQSAIQGIKFNPETPDSIKKMVIDNAEKELIKNSKFEDGKLVFLDPDGKVSIDTTNYQPKDALKMLSSMDAIKDISLKEKTPGGGADTTIVGKVQTKSIEGKDEKSLVLPEGIKTKKEFVEVSDKALLDSGITKRDPLWVQLKDKAYKELNIASLPAE